METDGAILGRIALAALLGYVIGWEREYRGSAAGDRTFALVALGSAAFTGLGAEHFPASAEKVIAGVVTGIGFLGAGLIFGRDGGGVHGLTTAASLWATAAVGVLLGAGEYFVGVAACAVLLFVLELEKLPGMKRFDADSVRGRRAERSREPVTGEAGASFGPEEASNR